MSSDAMALKSGGTGKEDSNALQPLNLTLLFRALGARPESGHGRSCDKVIHTEIEKQPNRYHTASQ